RRPARLDDPALAARRRRRRSKPYAETAAGEVKLVASLYKLAVGQEWVTRSEFWAMSPVELWWLVDAKKPRIGEFTHDEAEALYQDAIRVKRENDAGNR